MAVIERFFILTPTLTEMRKPIPSETGKPLNDKLLMVYHDASNKEMLWSGSKPIPYIGEKVFVNMNGIGAATVKGYYATDCENCCFVGVMVLPDNPPEYYKKNIQQAKKDPKAPNWRKEGIGCITGNELRMGD